VNIINFAFQPASVNVNVGDTVTWTQKDSIAHTSTSDAGVWNSPFLSLNQTFSQTFDTAGNFPYHCAVHPFMTGSVRVQGAPPPPTNQPPSVSITSPANGATVTDPVTIMANASDPDGSVASVQFFSGRTSLGQVSNPPYQITASLGAGTHNISAEATDNKGAIATSAVITVTVPAPNSPPTVSLSSPTNGASFTAPANITLTAQAADADGSVSMVEFFANGTSLGVISSSPFQFNWNNVPAGNYAITAKATDNAGASTVSAAVQISVNTPVNTTPPTLSGASKTSDGKFQFTVSGNSGSTYIVQASSDLHNWTQLQTVTAPANTFTVTDTPPSDATQRFYRAQLQQ
jgi:hypothetical protein